MSPAGLLRLAAASLLACASVVSAQDALIDLGNKSARSSRARGSDRLAGVGPSHVETLREFLRARHDETTLRDLVQTREHVSGGVAHETYGQRVGGLDVYGTYAKASFAANGELRSVIENLVSTARALRPARIGPEAALRAVIQRRYPGASADLPEESSVGNVVTFQKRPPFSHPPTVTRVALPLRGNVLDVGYLVVTWDRDNVLWHTVVSGRGEIVGEQLRTNADSYRIFPNHPGVTPQVLVNNPADPATSPVGWVTATTTVGNNVDAYLDRNNDNVADANGRPVGGSNKIFDFAWDGGVDPTVSLNQAAAVTNLFYLTNRLHDRLYGYGFTESAGNFQDDNFGNGGLGGDPLNAEAQDGGAVNNANFATPLDGTRPRMQMYLWNTATPNRDGDVDSDIVYHEYGHGLTWRMVGDMGGVTGTAVGEGMSDALAIYFNGDDRVAEYSSNNPIGIRQYPYTNYPRTYSLVVGILGPHLDGEIYAATLWRLRQLWLGKGWSQDILLTHLVDGLNYTIPKPAYEDMRDGILESIANLDTAVDPARARCTVWDAFAQFGIGVGASGQEICALGLCLFKATESFTKPPECPTGPTNTAPVPTILLPAPGTTVLVGTSVNFDGSASDLEDGSLTASMAWSSSVQGALGTGGSFNRSDLVAGTHVITASVTDSAGLTGSATVTLVVEPPPNTPPTVTILSPPNGTVVTVGTSVTFTGSAVDTLDGNISANLVWTSNLHVGPIGAGVSFSTAGLTVGAHAITAAVTDSGGLPGSAAIVVNVQAAPPPPYTLSVVGRKVKSKRFADLTWSGAWNGVPGGSVDIYRNNVRVVTTPNDGVHTDAPPNKGTTFIYRVCNAGTTVCSNDETVTF
jgi:extracellular elastinolytic metalloproteinase